MTTHMKLTLHEINSGREIANINDELPEVYDSFGTPEASMGSDLDGEYSVCTRYRDNNTAGWYYRAALCNLAMWQHKLGEPARVAAAEEALDKRRDELAETLSGVIGTQYVLRNRDIRNAIDMIIEMEGKP